MERKVGDWWKTWGTREEFIDFGVTVNELKGRRTFEYKQRKDPLFNP